MTRDEIVTALRCCAEPGRDCEEDCPMNEISREPCREVLAPAAADLIENQQRHIEALMKANDSLIALLITAIYTMYKKRSCTVFAVFVAVYVAAIIAIVVSEICG